MAAYYGTYAWVLGSRDVGETDRMICLYTQELGRIDALAKSVRAHTSKLKGHLNTFSKARILLTPGKDFWRLLDAEADLISLGTRKLLFAEECRAFFLRVVTHAMPDMRMWAALLAFQNIDSKDKVLNFKLSVLDALGILPDRIDENIDGQIEDILAQNHMV